MEDSVTDNEEKMTSGGNSPPTLPEDSPGSSVSTRLQEEYTELLKYTVNSVTLTEDGLDAENSLELGGPISGSSINLNNSETTCNRVLQPETSEKSSHRTKAETPQQSKASVDSAVGTMATKLDGLLGTLKENILAELTSLLIKSLETQSLDQQKKMNELTAEKLRLEKEINKLNEVMNGMEQSISRKDTLIDNLTQSLTAQKGKTEMARKFFNWKASHLDINREKFTQQLAVQHHNMKISHKVFKAWFGLIQTKWRSKVERVCQEQAQSVCLQLTNDYEAKICTLNETVKCLETKVANLQAEREAYSDQVKKAFMRGVCALNMEAMSAFNPEQQQSDSSFFGGTSSAAADTTHSMDITSNHLCSNLAMSQPIKDTGPGKSLPTELMTASTTDLHGDGSNLKEGSQPVSLPTFFPSSSQKPQIKSGVSVKTKATHVGPRPKSQSQVLAPPMASIVVERHQPITKQTVGKAAAIRYPKHGSKETSGTKSVKGGNTCKRPIPSSSTTGQYFKPLAGQTTKEDLLSTQVMSIKVVD